MQTFSKYIIIAFGFFAIYFYTGIRTAYFGISLGSSLLFFLGTASIVFLIGFVLHHHAKKALLTSLFIAFIVILSSELYAGIQEWQVVQKSGTKCEIGTYVKRWAPYSNHAIYCGEKVYWVGND